MRAKRIHISLVLLACWVILIIWRLASIQLMAGEKYASDVDRVSRIVTDETPRRGMILDRNERILAMSVTVPSICAYPPFIQDADSAAVELAPILKMPKNQLVELLSKDSQFVWLARQEDPHVGDAIFRLGLKGVGIRFEYRRVYPYGNLCGKILGTVGVDHEGLAGLEYAWNNLLSGVPGKRIFLKDAKRNDLDLNLLVKECVAGEDLHTSIDLDVQYIADREMTAGVKETQCISMAVTVMNPHSGEILAHALSPATDPSTPASYTSNREPDWLAKGVYEPGSTLKPMVAAFALEEGLVTPLETISGEGGSFKFKGNVIHDHEPYDDLTFEEALIHSSNVVFAKVGMRIPSLRFSNHLEAVGFYRKTGIDLPGEERGLLPTIDRWRENTPAYMALGQELAVTNAQLLHVYSALATDGSASVPHLNQTLDFPRDPIFSEDIVESLRPMLREVTISGTGQNAAISWTSVAGKTGTAQKPVPGKGYVEGKYISSFIGWFPADAPEYLVLIMVNEPAGKIYGGDVAAPIFARIARALCARGEICEI